MGEKSMPIFVEEIQSLCDAVYASKCERSTAVADVKSETAQLLDANRQQQQAVQDQQAAAAARLKEELATNCRDRSERVQAFRDQIRNERRAAADRLRQQLAENQQQRQEAVSGMLDGCRQVQQAFADQCQTASRLWQEMTGRPVGSA
jgi:F0F1-type ATP synthase membrane subunit b/b'